MLLGGKVRLIQQNANPMLYARSFVQGRYRVVRTLETAVPAASRFAEQWFYSLQNRIVGGAQLDAPLFSDLVSDFLKDPKVKVSVSHGQFANYEKKWNILKPFFAAVRITQINDAFLEDLQLKRADAKNRYGIPLKPSTIEKDLIFVRQVLNWGRKKKLLETEVPAIPTFKGKLEIIPQGRPRIPAEDWKRLTALARERAALADKERPQHKPGKRPNAARAWNLHDFIEFAVGGGLRTGEAYSVRWCDCSTTQFRDAFGKMTNAVRVQVLSKVGKGGKRREAWVMYGGYTAYKRMLKLRKGEPPELRLFPWNHEASFRSLLKDAGLYYDNETKMTRNTKCLRTTGICLRIENNPMVSRRDLADWARTSEEMIEKFYDQVKPDITAQRVAGIATAPRKKTTHPKRQKTNAKA